MDNAKQPIETTQIPKIKKARIFCKEIELFAQSLMNNEEIEQLELELELELEEINNQIAELNGRKHIIYQKLRKLHKHLLKDENQLRVKS